MPKLNRRSDGGYFVTNSFTRHGVTRHTTYQVEPRALEILANNGVRSGDDFAKELFFDLLEEELLITGKGGPGVQIAGNISQSRRDLYDEPKNRPKIPLTVTNELLNADGTFLSFGAFKLRYGGATGYPDDVLRPAYRELEKEYELSVERRFQEIFAKHRPTSIKRNAGKLIIEFTPRSEGDKTAPVSESDYVIRQAERRDRLRRESLRSRVDPMDKPGKSGGYQPTTRP